MLNVEQVIREVSGVYQSLTGRPIGPPRSELPPEVDPMGHIEHRYREFKGLVDSFGKPGPTAAPAPAWVPPMDVFELEREVRCEIDLPGVPRDRVTVSVAGDYLVIRGDRPNNKAQGGAERHVERRAGPFQKLVALPPRARRDGIEASCRDGVLTVIIPTEGSGSEDHEIPVDVKQA
jgi:HSP20 family protein